MPSFFACIGHAAVDHHFEIDTFAAQPTKTPAQSYRQIVGGMAANAAIGLARLGQSTRLIGRVGDDDAGRFIIASLAQLGVAHELLAVAGKHTSVSSVVVDARAERQIFTHRGNCLDHAPPLDNAQLSGAQAVLADPRWSDGAAAALVWARNEKVLSVLDADVAPLPVLQRLVPLAQWAVFSEPGLKCYAPEAATLGKALAQALDAGAHHAMVTLGEQGVAWMHADLRQIQTHPAFSVQARDTTGAGDIFHGALTFALSQQPLQPSAPQVHQAIRFACAAAALKCTQAHGALGAPSMAQVQRFLQTHPS